MKSVILLICIIFALTNATPLLRAYELQADREDVLKTSKFYQSLFREAFDLELDLTVCGEEIEKPSEFIVDLLDSISTAQYPLDYAFIFMGLIKAPQELHRELKNCPGQFKIFDKGVEAFKKSVRNDLISNEFVTRFIANFSSVSVAASDLMFRLRSSEPLPFDIVGEKIGYIVGSLLTK